MCPYKTLVKGYLCSHPELLSSMQLHDPFCYSPHNFPLMLYSLTYSNWFLVTICDESCLFNNDRLAVGQTSSSSSMDSMKWGHFPNSSWKRILWAICLNNPWPWQSALVLMSANRMPEFCSCNLGTCLEWIFMMKSLKEPSLPQSLT